jgi:hypothetical protein
MCRPRDASHDRQVFLPHRARPHRSYDGRVRGFRLRHQHDPRRVLVQPLQQPRVRAAFAQVPEHGIEKRSLHVLVGRMHDDAGGLVDGEQVFVLEEDVERERLWPGCFAAPRGGQPCFDPIAGRDASRGLRGHDAIDVHAACLDGRLQPSPRERQAFAHVSQQHEIQADARVSAVGRQDVTFHFRLRAFTLQAQGYILTSCASKIS